MDFDATEHAALALMFGVFEHGAAKRRLVGELAGMSIEIAVRPLAHRTGDAPSCDEIMPPVAGRRHRKGRLADKRDEKAVSAAAKRDARDVRGFVGSGR